MVSKPSTKTQIAKAIRVTLVLGVLGIFLRLFFLAGAPDKIRTCGLWLRRPTLYPAELRAH